MNEVIAKTLYRSLLRTATPFASSANGPVLCSLIYRTGLDDHIDHTAMSTSNLSNRKKESYGRSHAEYNELKDVDDMIMTADSYKDVHLSDEEARDLTRTYDELRQIHFQRMKDTKKEHQVQDDEDAWMSFRMNANGISKYQKQQTHKNLYKRLLRQLFLHEKDGNVRDMLFPSQTLSSDNQCTMGNKIIGIIKQEFRNKPDPLSSASSTTYLSQYFTDSTRREAGFLALRELQKKLEWAEKMGMTNLFHQPITRKEDEERQKSMKEKEENQSRWCRQQASKNVHRLPIEPASSYLQSGSFLVAHPMLSGIFSKSVICILQQTDVTGRDQKINLEDEEVVSRVVNGGTYGLIINSEVTVGDSSRKSHSKLREVIRHNCLPEGVKLAFGNCSVRNGGPVNLSVQMLRSSTSEMEDKLRIGGTVLPDISMLNSETEVLKSSAQNTDKAIYFGGNIIKAAQAVIDGQIERDAFSFVIGASCWEIGQLESEIARGYWLPCCGPPELAFTGASDSYDKEINIEETTEKPNISRLTKNDSKSDFWLSMMCATSDSDGRVADLVLNDIAINELGDACDDV
mmetsp:Transcript_14424/g.17533  ORF Transcript_14424/g.17533 Transcript_14424/m.17533 type:complete len:573 (+) Transcript_14424:49-1767(+)